jgi:hypothetical protein
MYGRRDVLELLLTEILEGEVEPSRGILLHAAEMQMPPGSAKPSSRAAALTLSEDVAVLDHNIAHVDADTELDALIRRYRR